MIELDFAVDEIEPARRALVPTLLFRLRMTNRAPDLPVEHVSLQAQIRIEAPRRDYTAAERERLSELFGGAADWDRSLRGLMWTTVGAAVPGFAGECTVSLAVPCSCDFNIAATKYFEGLEEGDAPLLLLFSGSVFWRDAAGDLQIAQIPHHKEASFRLPASTWQDMMRRYYPDGAWLRIGHELFCGLRGYQRQTRATSLDEALGRLLEAAPR